MIELKKSFYLEEEIIGSLQNFESETEGVLDIPKFGEVTPLFLGEKYNQFSKFPTVQIGNLPRKKALIQGGMGSGISNGEMAGQVAKEDGLGTVTSVLFGLKKGESNEETLAKELIHARSIAGKNGVIGVNIMKALADYKKLVGVALQNGAQFLTVGAGLPLDLAKLTKDYPNVALFPIVSGGRAIKSILKSWAKENRKPDAVIYEHPSLAGGHGGGELEKILANNPQYFYRYGLAQVFDALSEFGRERGDESYENIPVFAAGGIQPADMLYILNLTNSRQRVAGIQIATPFLTTDVAGILRNAKQKNVDVNKKFVQAHLQKTPTALIRSTANKMPGRVLLNNFVEDQIEKLQKFKKRTRAELKFCVGCLGEKYCKFDKMLWCIMQRLSLAKSGDTKNGLLFSGRRPFFDGGTVGEVMRLYENGFQN